VDTIIYDVNSRVGKNQSTLLPVGVYTTLLVLMIDHDGSDDVEVGIIMKFTVNRFRKFVAIAMAGIFGFHVE
jgi:hypothetical protein